ncbi:MAG: RBBP9/YdeN family alpha/beta hydrolase [Beijerinckiaceae bacterium]
MRTSEAEILFVPGSNMEDSDHWMNRWQSRLPTARRVVSDSDNIDSLAAAVSDALASDEARPVVLIGHGAGVHAIAHAARAADTSRVRGAFLVNPSSVWNLPAPSREPLPFPSIMVISRDDPHGTYEEMQDLGYDWGAHIIDAGPVGRIDAGSGHGPWPEGLMRFGAFIARL